MRMTLEMAQGPKEGAKVAPKVWQTSAQVCAPLEPSRRAGYEG